MNRCYTARFRPKRDRADCTHQVGDERVPELPERDFMYRADGSHYVVSVGSVGQPRDGDPRASFATWDDQKDVLHFHRVEYDVAAARQDILDAGLPARLAGTHLVYEGRRLVLVSRKSGKDIAILVPPDHPRLPGFLGLFREWLERSFEPLRCVRVEVLNGEPTTGAVLQVDVERGVFDVQGVQEIRHGFEPGNTRIRQRFLKHSPLCIAEARRRPSVLKLTPRTVGLGRGLSEPRIFINR